MVSFADPCALVRGVCVFRRPLCSGPGLVNIYRYGFKDWDTCSDLLDRVKQVWGFTPWFEDRLRETRGE